MKYSANDVLRAMESDMGLETVPAVPETPVEDTPSPVPTELTAETVGEDMKTNAFIMMLKHALSPEQFSEVMCAATDMEVYGLIPNAEKLRLNCQAMIDGRAKCLADHAITSLAVDMAVAANCESGNAYVTAEETMDDAVIDIRAKFGDMATQVLRDMLAENARRAINMEGPTAVLLRDAIAKMQESLAATTTQE